LKNEACFFRFLDGKKMPQIFSQVLTNLLESSNVVFVSPGTARAPLMQTGGTSMLELEADGDPGELAMWCITGDLEFELARSRWTEKVVGEKTPSSQVGGGTAGGFTGMLGTGICLSFSCVSRSVRSRMVVRMVLMVCFAAR